MYNEGHNKGEATCIMKDTRKDRCHMFNGGHNKAKGEATCIMKDTTKAWVTYHNTTDVTSASPISYYILYTG